MWLVTFREILQSSFLTGLSALLPEGSVWLKLTYLILSHLSTLRDEVNIPRLFVNMKITPSARKTAGDSKQNRYRSLEIKGVLIINEECYGIGRSALHIV